MYIRNWMENIKKISHINWIKKFILLFKQKQPIEKINPNWQPHNLQNSIVTLQPLKETDFEKLFEVASDPHIWDQHPSKNRYIKTAFRIFFDSLISNPTAFLIIDKTTNKIIGSTRYNEYNREESRICIGGTFLSRNYWGTQYNKTIKYLLLDYAFKFVKNVFFHVSKDNIRSQKSLLSIGAKKVGEVEFDHYGEKVLHYKYLIKKTDWIQNL
ncbi:GNAT family protein [uncultured Cytophaga sp.]|uniref:GNAT family N-acetyltransferase n=1 Tax=uncultured Cytophaga sp. TaxID=160238 RepID=UPI0026374433|nr:GNAT family protein [uncultured Cytophaga sp.]